MSLWRQLTRGVRVIIARDAADHDVADEVAFYMEQATAAYLAQGLPPDAAHRAAQREIGNMTGIREQVRTYGWENVVGTVIGDLVYAVRRLRSECGFAVVAILTLGLGLGATTAIFSVVKPILFGSLPYPRANEVVTLTDVASDGSRVAATFGNYQELSVRAHSFSALAVADHWRPTFTDLAEPERLEGERVSAAYFRALGVSPSLGRDFVDADQGPQGLNVVIVSERLASGRLGGDSGIVGRHIALNGDPYEIIGVMPPGFQNVLAPSVEIWAPEHFRPVAPFTGPEWGHHSTVIGRLRPNVSIDQARHELKIIASDSVSEFPRPMWANMQPAGLVPHALQDQMSYAVRPVLLALLGAALMVLAIACVNVTNLLLARGARRRGEFAVRAALGAERRRLMRQLLTETTVLAAIGAICGLVIAELGVRALIALSPPGLPRVDAISVDGPVFAFTLAISLLVGLAVGLAPAIEASRSNLHAGLQHAGRRNTRHGLMGRTLVVAEVALALMLLISAGLLLRSLARLSAVQPGFAPAHVLTMQLVEAGHAYDADSARVRFFAQALEAVGHVPGVVSAALTSQMPLGGDVDGYGYEFASISPNSASAQADGSAFRYAVTPDYFRTMGIPLVSGRLLDDGDVPGAREAIVISESFAKRKFPGQSAIGERVRFGPEIGDTSRTWGVVVGIVGDVKQQSLALNQPDAFYVAPRQWAWVDNVRTLVVRTSGSSAVLAPAIKQAVWSVDRHVPIIRVATAEHLVSATAAERRFALTLFEAFAVVALVLAAVGIYGILSGSVSERTRELGVRAALGASSGEIIGLVLRQGMTLTVLGVVIGVAGAAAASRVLSTLLFGVSDLDPTTYAGVIVLLTGVSATACLLPAWRAASVDPTITLRAE